MADADVTDEERVVAVTRDRLDAIVANASAARSVTELQGVGRLITRDVQRFQGWHATVKDDNVKRYLEELISRLLAIQEGIENKDFQKGSEVVSQLIIQFNALRKLAVDRGLSRIVTTLGRLVKKCAQLV